MTDIVIGSGPAGISAARALLDRGRTVVLLDGGKTLEPPLAKRRDDLAAMAPETWEPARIDTYQEPQFATPEGQARRFGSDFAMEPAGAILEPGADWFGLRMSRAVGGLSNLWGSAVLPYRQADLADWPVSADDLSPHYGAVAKFMPVAGRPDTLNTLFAAHQIDQDTSLNMALQAQDILARLGRMQPGTHLGASRVAVGPDCRSCGQCLHGCPWGAIYSSQHTLTQLRSEPNFSHRPGQIVQAFEETDQGVLIQLVTGETVTGERVFIGAGVLETARILLNSAPQSNRTLTLLDSQHSLIPLLHHWRPNSRPDRGPLTTLPQLFLELDDPQISPHLIHSQIYTWNEHYARDLMANYGFGLGLAKPVLQALARHLIVAQAFLHSDHSARIDLALGGNGKIVPQLRENPQTKPVLRAAQRRIGKTLARAGLTMLGFASRPGNPGSSFHVGGTVPMAQTPQSNQADTLGRPHGLNRVHLVDASVFPSIPATTITFSAMANAHRIGSLAP